MMPAMDSTALKVRAHELGFYSVGIAAADVSPHAERYREWLAAGRHGTMDYLARNVERRIDPRETLPGAKSVIVVTLPYVSDVDFPAPDDSKDGRIARYARGRDYHKVMPPRLRELARHIADDDAYRTWYTADTGPLLERDWAERAGVGWIGKNAVVIDPEVGSWFFLGVVVTDRPYPPDPPATDHCGTCRRCLDACPTDAFVGERSVDARRCISYWTIEHRGELGEFEDRLDGWIFGCDICQEVCPFNRRSGRTAPPVLDDFTPRALPTDLDSLADIDRERFLQAFAGTAVTRTGWQGIARNAHAVRSAKRGEATRGEECE